MDNVILQRYKAIAHEWNLPQYAQIRRDDLLPKILAYSEIDKLPNHPRVLDAMCGTGIVGSYINKKIADTGRKCDLHYLDFSLSMLALAPNDGIKKIANVTKLPYQDSFFDLIVLRCSIHDIKKEKQIKAISEINRVIKQGGIFIFCTFYVEPEIQAYYNTLLNLKDALAGYQGKFYRYFPSLTEIWEMLRVPGFRRIELKFSFESSINYRETELSEEKYKLWELFVSSLPNDIKKQMGIRKKGRIWHYQLPGTIFRVIK